MCVCGVCIWMGGQDLSRFFKLQTGVCVLVCLCVHVDVVVYVQIMQVASRCVRTFAWCH